MHRSVDDRHTRAREILAPVIRLVTFFALTTTLIFAPLHQPISGQTARADPIEISVRPVHLNPDKPSIVRAGQLRFRGGLRLSSRDRRFGGLSGITFIGPDQLLAVSDRGWWISFRIVEKKGQLVGISDATLDPMRDVRGDRLTSDRDAEALEIAADGTLVVAFERRHRLWRYPPPPGYITAPALELRGLAAWSALPSNGGFEAIAMLAGDRRLLVSEQGREGETDLAAWLFDGGQYQRLTYVTIGEFVPTDLARLASGDLIALERRFTAVGGFASRLQIIDQRLIRPGARVVGREIARFERPLLIENFEGIAVRDRPDGAVDVFVVSDDNYNPLQRTLLLSFRLEAADAVGSPNAAPPGNSAAPPVR